MAREREVNTWVETGSDATIGQPEGLRPRVGNIGEIKSTPPEVSHNNYYHEIGLQDFANFFKQLPLQMQRGFILSTERALAMARSVDWKVQAEKLKWGIASEGFYAIKIAELINSGMITLIDSQAQKARKAIPKVASNAGKAIRDFPRTTQEIFHTAVEVLRNGDHQRGGEFTLAQGLKFDTVAVELGVTVGCAVSPFLPIAPKSGTRSPVTPTQIGIVQCIGEDNPRPDLVQANQDRIRRLIEENGSHWEVQVVSFNGYNVVDVRLSTPTGDVQVARLAESETDPRVTCVSTVDDDGAVVYASKNVAPPEANSVSLVRAIINSLNGGKVDSIPVASLLISAGPPENSTPAAPKKAASVTPTVSSPTETPTVIVTATPPPTAESKPTIAPKTETPTAPPTPEVKVPSLEELNKKLIFSGPADTHIGRPIVGQWNTDGWDNIATKNNASAQETTDGTMGKFVRYTRTGVGVGPSDEVRYHPGEFGQKIDGNIAVTMKFRIGPKNTGGNSNILTTFGDRNADGSIMSLLANVNFDPNRLLTVYVYDPENGDNRILYESDIRLDSNRWYNLELRAFRGTKFINVLLDGKPVLFHVKDEKTGKVTNKPIFWLPSYQNAKDVSLVGLHGGYYKYIYGKAAFQYDADDYIDNTQIDAYTFDYPFPQGD